MTLQTERLQTLVLISAEHAVELEELRAFTTAA